MNKHTPTPWHIEVHFGANQIVREEENDPRLRTHIAEVSNSTEARANAEFITRAVNSHEALLTALRECVTEEGAAGLQEGLGRMKRRILAINDIARAAIAMATGNAIPTPKVSENLNQPL